MNAIPHIPGTTPGAIQDLIPTQAITVLGQVELIDVREPEEFTGPLGHIEGAKLVPLATVAEEMKAWDPSKTYLLICRSGARSARAGAVMVQAGFSRVYNLTGGMSIWNHQGLPVERAV